MGVRFAAISCHRNFIMAYPGISFLYAECKIAEYGMAALAHHTCRRVYDIFRGHIITIAISRRYQNAAIRLNKPAVGMCFHITRTPGGRFLFQYFFMAVLSFASWAPTQKEDSRTRRAKRVFFIQECTKNPAFTG